MVQLGQIDGDGSGFAGDARNESVGRVGIHRARRSNDETRTIADEISPLPHLVNLALNRRGVEGRYSTVSMVSRSLVKTQTSDAMCIARRASVSASSS